MGCRPFFLLVIELSPRLFHKDTYNIFNVQIFLQLFFKKTLKFDKSATLGGLSYNFYKLRGGD